MRPTGVWLWLDHLVLTLLTKSLPAMNITFKSTHTHSNTDTVSQSTVESGRWMRRPGSQMSVRVSYLGLDLQLVKVPGLGAH